MKYYLIYSEFIGGRLIEGTGHVLKKYNKRIDAICCAQSNLLDYRDSLEGSEVYVSENKNYYRLRYKSTEMVYQIIEGD